MRKSPPVVEEARLNDLYAVHFRRLGVVYDEEEVRTRDIGKVTINQIVEKREILVRVVARKSMTERYVAAFRDGLQEIRELSSSLSSVKMV
jgi:hypothetical protein